MFRIADFSGHISVNSSQGAFIGFLLKLQGCGLIPLMVQLKFALQRVRSQVLWSLAVEPTTDTQVPEELY
jgi:hypothetical protein